MGSTISRNKSKRSEKEATRTNQNPSPLGQKRPQSSYGEQDLSLGGVSHFTWRLGNSINRHFLPGFFVPFTSFSDSIKAVFFAFSAPIVWSALSAFAAAVFLITATLALLFGTVGTLAWPFTSKGHRPSFGLAYLNTVISTVALGASLTCSLLATLSPFLQTVSFITRTGATLASAITSSDSTENIPLYN